MYITYLVVIKTVCVCSKVVTCDVNTDGLTIGKEDFLLVEASTICVGSEFVGTTVKEKGVDMMKVDVIVDVV